LASPPLAVPAVTAAVTAAAVAAVVEIVVPVSAHQKCFKKILSHTPCLSPHHRWVGSVMVA